tara:strand:- start:122 stop:523 length:402 start_codon:yes stop_codon:yes gene_type:complete
MNQTLALIKPDAVERNLIGNIITIIETNQFIIKDIKLMKMTVETAEEFYSCHRGKPFFNKLINYMTSGEIVALLLEKDDAVLSYRNLIGSTDPETAEEGTIRKLYAIDKSHNSVHGSDSDDNAQREISIIFRS